MSNLMTTVMNELHIAVKLTYKNLLGAYVVDPKNPLHFFSLLEQLIERAISLQFMNPADMIDEFNKSSAFADHSSQLVMDLLVSIPFSSGKWSEPLPIFDPDRMRGLDALIGNLPSFCLEGTPP